MGQNPMQARFLRRGSVRMVFLTAVHDGLALAATILMLLLAGTAHSAGVFYADPGWAYAYNGDQAYYNDPDGPNPDYLHGTAANEPGGKGNTAALEFPGYLDPSCNPATTVCAVNNDAATWIHSGSQWDGSAPGDPLGGSPGDPVPIPPAAPGGVETYTQDGVSYLRIQDAGNPQSWGWADKGAQASLNSSKQEGNNRRIQFSHKIARDAAYSGNGAVLDNGITIAFRTRLATVATGPLAPFLNEDGPSATAPIPWPADGKGYPVSNNGRGMFMVTQNGAAGPGQLAFSLLDTNTINDQGLSIAKTGLVFNNKGGGPDTNDATAESLNIVEVDNGLLTEWQEFWITVKKLDTPINQSTHEVSVYYNGSLTPQVFPVVLGNQNEFGSGPHLGLGLSSGTRWGAYDIDYFAYKEGLIAPQLANATLAGDYNGNDIVDAADYTVWRDHLGSAFPLQNETETPGAVTVEDYNAWKTNFGATAGSGSLAGAAAVPEPATLSLLALALGVVAARRNRALSSFRLVPMLIAIAAAVSVPEAAECTAAETQPPTHASLQDRLDEAPEHSVVDFAMTEFVTLDKPLRVAKPLTVRGLRLQLPPKLPRTQLLQTNVEGFSLTDSHFRGNADTVGQDQRASLVEVRAGKFRVERCTFENSSKNGLTIDPGDTDQPLIGGVVRDIVGHGVVRDVVSLSGGSRGGTVRDVLVENVYASDSSLRGAVEVSDRTWDVTVRGVTADRCVYAVDVQDHDLATDINRNVLLEDIRARNCRHAVRTATDPIGHNGLTIRNVVAEDCDVPLRIDHIANVLVDGVHIIGRERDPAETNDLECAFQIKGCTNVTIRNVVIEGVDNIPAPVKVVDTSQLLVDRLVVDGKNPGDAAILLVSRKGPAASSIESVEFRSIIAPHARRFPVAYVDGNHPDELKEVRHEEFVTSFSHPRIRSND